MNQKMIKLEQLLQNQDLNGWRISVGLERFPALENFFVYELMYEGILVQLGYNLNMVGKDVPAYVIVYTFEKDQDTRTSSVIPSVYYLRRDDEENQVKKEEIQKLLTKISDLEYKTLFKVKK